MKILTALFFAAVFNVAAQSPEVPRKMEVAGIKLTLDNEARAEIQKDVDALTRSPTHYNIKVERAKTYFPIIEQIFREEEVPDDFKYLVLQESALIADAVSVSNAVGFWQFKDFTAIEMGLRVDKQIDERLNIVSSTRAAARYLKKNNEFFNNWIYALQAYQMGAGGVLKAVDETQSGAGHMDITHETYWYVKKFLAHKIAYEPAFTGTTQNRVVTYPNSIGKSLAELAKEVSVDEEELRSYNKWTKSGNVPTDKTYVVLIPLQAGANASALADLSENEDREERLPEVSAVHVEPVKGKTNGIRTIQAIAGESAAALALRAGVKASRFVRWNDLSSKNEILIEGNYYFLSRKRVRAMEDFHKVLPGETLWSISQFYGVQEKKLRRYNRLSAGKNPSAGTMLWLASRRPKSEPAMPVENPVIVDSDESFNWPVDTAEAVSVTGVVQQDSIVISGDQVKKYEDTEQPSDSLVIAEEEFTASSPANAETTPSETAIAETHHIVEAGETLYSISKFYDVGVMDLVNWNNLNLQDKIKPGQVLRFSGPETSTTREVKASRELIHEVKSSDTLYSIARQYGVTIKELMDWNQKKDFSLAVGEKLKIRQPQ